MQKLFRNNCKESKEQYEQMLSFKFLFYDYNLSNFKGHISVDTIDIL